MTISATGLDVRNKSCDIADKLRNLLFSNYFADEERTDAELKAYLVEQAGKLTTLAARLR
jgi:hypothetical protein